MRNPSHCPSDAKLREYLEKSIDAGAEAQVAEHLSSCSLCDARLAALAEQNDGLLQHLAYFRNTQSKAKTTSSSHQHIGSYEILETLGEGGLGTVYLARQHAPVRRRVALKVIKAGMDTRAVVARFEAERQALAVMDHPHVAKVFDGGVTPEGRPYFVMEYVAGEPITDYCDRNKLGMRDRLDLFMGVCEAVQHAHQKGIIHRDIKPSNVLVSVKEGRAAPKVIDFGVAKATNQQLTEKTIYTEQGVLIGTPEYMSPEQAEMGATDVDTRTDIYSLGVLLYETLTGTLPFDSKTLRRAGYAEIQRIIREVDPPRPSTRLSSLSIKATERLGEAETVGAPAGRAADAPDKPSERIRPVARPRKDNDTSLAAVAARRQCDPRTLLKAIRGDLDWIVMKCLEKDRARRYDTANAVAMEIQRYLRNEPVLAGPPSAAYRLKKFILRKRGAMIAAAFILLTLIGGIIGTGIGLINATQQAALAEEQRLRAEKQRANAERTADFMASMLDRVKASVALGRDTTMLREMLDSVARRIEGGELRDSPEAELRLRWTIGGAYRDIADGGANERAEKIIAPALELARETNGAESEEMGRSFDEWAYCLDALGRSTEALPKYEAALALRQRLFEGDHPQVAQCLNNLAYCLNSLGRSTEALPKFEAALAMRSRLFKGDHSAVATSLNNVAHCLNSLGRSSEALPKYEAALEMRRRLFNGDHPHVAQTLNNVASCLEALGRASEALPKHEAALEMWGRLLKGDHPNTARALNNVASCLHALGKSSEALPKYEAALEINQRLYKGDHPDVAGCLNNVASCLDSLGRSNEALPKYEAALEMHRRLFKGDHPHVAQSLNNVAYCLDSLERSGEALPKHEAALGMWQRLFKGDHPHVAGSLNNVASCLDSLGRSGEALPKYEAALEMRRRLFPGDHPHLAQSLNNVATCLRSLGRPNEALPMFEAALAMFRRVLPANHPNAIYPQIGMAEAFVETRRFAEAESQLLRALEQCEGSSQSRRLHTPRILKRLVELYDAWDINEPGKGFDQKAAEWRVKLGASRATTQPVATRLTSFPPLPTTQSASRP